MTSLDAERLAHGVTNTIVALTPRLSDFHQILVDPPKVNGLLCSTFTYINFMMCTLTIDRMSDAAFGVTLGSPGALLRVINFQLYYLQQYFSPMPTTLGQLDPPLGNSRLQVAKLLATLLHTNTHSLNVVLENLGTMNVLLVSLFLMSEGKDTCNKLVQCLNTLLTLNFPKF